MKKNPPITPMPEMTGTVTPPRITKPLWQRLTHVAALLSVALHAPMLHAAAKDVTPPKEASSKPASKTKSKSSSDKPETATTSKTKKTELAATEIKKTPAKSKADTAKTDTKAAATKTASKSSKATALADADDAKPSKSKTATKVAVKSTKSKADLCEAETVKASAKASKSAKTVKASLKKTSKTTKSKAKGCASKSRAEKPDPIPATISFAPAIAAVSTGPQPYTALRSAPARSFDAAALSAADAALYRQAFDQISAAKFDDSRETMTQVSDRSLAGYVDYARLMSASYESTYEELQQWMGQYGELPVAMTVWNLAKRKKPAYAPDPAFPVMMRGQNPAQLAALDPESGVTRLSSTTSLSGGEADLADLPAMTVDLTPKSARSAYNDGNLEQAIKLGTQIGDRWVAGLASYRLKRYAEAREHFEFIAKDPSQNAWSRSGGAYWAGRCALLLNNAEEAQIYFRLAASFPFTFYGLVAEQKLGVESAVTRARNGQPPLLAAEERTALSASLDADFGWTKSDPQAKRIAALLVIDRRNEARTEMQNAVQRAADPAVRDRWLALAAWSNLSVNGLKRSDKLFDFSSYDVPDYRPVGGFTLDRALVYALARKESKFDPKAISYSGAYGLMQIMPATAALVTDDPTLRSKPSKLLKAGVNMRVGQDYIHRLLDTQIINGDLLRAVAAYNGGPRPVQDALQSLGPNPDPLLVMESIPVAQTRAYVEEVVATYWIYQKLMDKPSATLKQAASDAPVIRAYDDARLAEKAPEKASDKSSAKSATVEKPASVEKAASIRNEVLAPTDAISQAQPAGAATAG